METMRTVLIGTFQRSLAVASVAALVSSAALAGCSSDEPASEGTCSGSESALKICANGPVVRGVDVSKYQGTVDWAAVKASGRVFAFARIGDGVNTQDTTFATNWPAMKKAGLVRGAYQFFRPGQDANAQADIVIAKLGKIAAGDLPAVLDLESADGQPSATVIARAKAWLARVEAGTGRRPIVYTAAFMSSTIGSTFGAWPLWVANYGTTCPTMPTGWADWKIWQGSSTGSVPGISGAVDTNEFKGTLADLMTFAEGSPAPVDAGPPPPPPAVDAGSPPVPHEGDGNAMGDGLKIGAWVNGACANTTP
jgi:lysozyme